ncbi:MAG: DUF4294 domain-containing protein [Solitalea-like symbiont of Tyrophagus putrescentiae]
MNKVLFMLSFSQILIAHNISLAQNINKPNTNIHNNQQTPIIMLDPVYLTSDRIFPNHEAKLKYLKLERDVAIALRYAKELVNELNSLDYDLLECKKKKERDLVLKKHYNKLKIQIIGISKELTPTQGKIIIKLINRQTGHTTYQLLADKLGSINASLIQVIVRGLGQNLKSTYNIIQDYEIESIVKKLEKTE